MTLSLSSGPVVWKKIISAKPTEPYGRFYYEFRNFGNIVFPAGLGPQKIHASDVLKNICSEKTAEFLYVQIPVFVRLE